MRTTREAPSSSFPSRLRVAVVVPALAAVLAGLVAFLPDASYDADVSVVIADCAVVAALVTGAAASLAALLLGVGRDRTPRDRIARGLATAAAVAAFLFATFAIARPLDPMLLPMKLPPLRRSLALVGLAAAAGGSLALVAGWLLLGVLRALLRAAALCRILGAVFFSTPAGVLLWLLAIGVMAAAGMWGRTPARDRLATVPSVRAERTPSVLLIVLDTVRADRLSCYGHKSRVPTSPALDLLAAEGALCEDATTAAIVSVTSHACLFTGRYSSGIGVTYEHSKLAPERVTLAEALRGAGYRTIAVTGNPWINDDVGLTQGFQDVVMTFRDSPRRDPKFLTLFEGFDPAENLREFMEWIPRARRPEVPATAPNRLPPPAAKWAWPKDGWRTQAELLHAIDTLPDDQPFYIFANYIDAHPYFNPPHPHDAMFVPDKALRRYLHGLRQDERAHSLGLVKMSPEDYEGLRRLYDGEIHYLNTLLADVFRRLKSKGRLDDTIVVVVGDHGCAIGEHGVFGHQYSLCQELIHVPMIWRYPPAIPAGTRVQGPTQLVDVMPTVLELCGIDPELLPDQPQGVSLAGAFQSGQSPRTHAVTELTNDQKRIAINAHEFHVPNPHYPDTGFTFRDASGWKLVTFSDGTEELYFLPDDPREQHDRAADEPDVLADLRMKAEAWHLEFATAIPTGEAPELTPQLEAALEALGYTSRAKEPAGQSN